MKEKKPLAQNGEIILYQPDNSIRLEVRMEEDTVWLTQAQMAKLFGTQRAAITKHLNNIYKSGEIERETTCSILEHVGQNGTRLYHTTYYNLDAILSVGYRVNSKNATIFRRWATKTLKEYLLRGYTINQRFLQAEQRIDRQLQEHSEQIHSLQDKVDFFVRTALPPVEGVFYDGQIFGASLKDLGKKLFAFSRMEMAAEEVLP